MNEAIIEKEKALAQVSASNKQWMELGLQSVQRMPKDELVTGEKIRHFVSNDVGLPKHHNAWGALIRAARKSGMIVPTGRWPQMEDVQSHARQAPEYVIT